MTFGTSWISTALKGVTPSTTLAWQVQGYHLRLIKMRVSETVGMLYLVGIRAVFQGPWCRLLVLGYYDAVSSCRPVKVTFSRPFLRSFAPVVTGAATSQLKM